MTRAVALCLLWLAGACGSSSTHYVQQGDCVAPSPSAPVDVAWNRELACQFVGGVVVVTSDAQLDGLCPQGRRDNLGSDLPAIDFTRQELIAIGGQQSEGLNFLVDDGTTLHLGLVGLIRGIAQPNVGLAIAQTAHPLQVHTCQTVCEGYCPPVP